MIKDTVKDLFIGIARTASPMIAGYVISLFAMAGLELSPEQQVQVSFLVFSAISLLYYVLARVCEEYVSPKFGWLLGVAKTPDYTKTLESNKEVGSKKWDVPLVNGDEGRAG